MKSQKVWFITGPKGFGFEIVNVVLQAATIVRFNNYTINLDIK
jgi:hypothetical protein